MPQRASDWTLWLSPLLASTFQPVDEVWRNRVRYVLNLVHLTQNSSCTVRLHVCLQHSNLFFTAIDKVSQYAAKAGHLPVIVSENVAGRRVRRTIGRKVSTT
jgi:hypothetical protein